MSRGPHAEVDLFCFLHKWFLQHFRGRSTPVTKEMEVLRWVDETAHATEGVVKRLHTEDLVCEGESGGSLGIR